MNPIQDLKLELKTLAQTIKENRPKFRQAQSCASRGIAGGASWWELCSVVAKAQYEFRHKHIVRCLLRGRTRDQIEKPTKNFPDEKYIEKLLGEYNAKLETLCRRSA